MEKIVKNGLVGVTAFFIVLLMCGSIYAYPQLQSIEKAGIRLHNLSQGIGVEGEPLVYEDGMIPIYLVLLEQYDTDKLYSEVRNMPKKQRREHTVNTLKQFSRETQKELRLLIEGLEQDNRVSKTRFLWITNVIGLYADVEAIRQFDEHPDVRLIEYDPLQYVLIDDHFDLNSADYYASGRGADSRRREDERSSGLKYRDPADNVAHHNAPEVWEQGYMGQGAVVSVIDTGVNYNHNDIRNQMWTHPDFPFHGYNTFADTNQPLDDHRHGSHCAGTVAGNGDSGTITGIAPRATIMALKCLNGAGSGQEQMYWAAVEFSVEYGADVLSVSLGWRYSGNPNRAEFRRVMANTLNAGVVASIAAGNEATSGLRTPGDCPPPWLHPDQTNIGGLTATITVGATDLQDRIANFSSRGPVTWQTIDPYNDYPLNPGIGLIQPDICAVGVDVLSLVHNNNTGYTRMSGTSMATPALAGVIALLLSKNPNLTPEDISQILEETAIPLSDSKSNIFGSGLVDPVAAIEAAAFITIHEVSYNDGNNNIPEYGETVSIDMTLINLGIEEAEEIIAVLSTEDEYVEILQNRAEFGAIEQDSTGTVEEAFTVRIADNIPDAHKVLFTVNIAISEDLSWDFPLSMEVSAPRLITLIPQILDAAPGGNNNSFIDPGEDVVMYLPIKNAGGSTSPIVNLTVNSLSEMVAITEVPRTQFEEIWSGETIYPAIMISVSEAAEYEEMLDFSYRFETGEYVFEGVFTAIVGGMIPAYLGTGEQVSDNNVASPINLYFRSLRSQTVYTAAELNAAGVYGYLPITQLGYYVFGAPDDYLPNFKIRIKHTDSENVAAHDDGPFETVYQVNRYEPVTNRWDLLTLQAPFLWNGVDNLLIDTSFSPTQDWSTSGQVRIYEVAEGFRYARADSPDQANVPTREVTSHKPQILMIFDTVVGGEFSKPENLTAELIGLDVQLNWDIPENGDRRENNRTLTRRRAGELAKTGRESSHYRNPDGYNIYRNGLLLNEELVTENGYLDRDYNSLVSYYYYVTAVYEDGESPASNIVNVQFRTATPEATPGGNIHYDSFQVTLQCETPDAVIYYTIDGSEPDRESTLYEEPFDVENDLTLKARAYRENWLESNLLTINYHILYAPTDLEAEGRVNAVYLTWNSPTGELGLQNDPESLTRSNGQRNRMRERYERSELTTRTLRGYNIYRLVAADSFAVINPEPVEEEHYLDQNIPSTGQLSYYLTAVYEAGESLPAERVNVRSIVAKPSFSPQPGDFEDPFDLTISVSTGNALIYFTLDESEPDEDAYLFNPEEPVRIETTTIVKAMAMLDGWVNSDVSTGYFAFPANTDEELLPVYATELLNAYPNPFNPETVIALTMKEAGRVRLEVFNITGRRVALLADEIVAPGRYEYVWQANDERGVKLSSGIYFYRMTTTDYSEVKKMLMLK